MKDIRVFSNNEYYLYESIDGDDNCVYNMYAAFNGVYNHDNAHSSKPLLETGAISTDKKMLFAFDCSRQNESLKTGSVDVKIEFETTANIAANTRAYCLMIHVMIKEYRPLTGLVQSA